MTTFRVLLIVLSSVILTNCSNRTKDEIQNSNIGELKTENKIDKRFLTLDDLTDLISKDILNKKVIIEFLKRLDEHWAYIGTDEKGLHFMKSNDESSNGIITYFSKYHIIEYLLFSKNQFFNISRSIKSRNFALTDSKKNEYGRDVSTYASKDIVIILEEIPLTTPGESGFKVLIGQKR